MSNKNKQSRKPATAAASKEIVKANTSNEVVTENPIVEETLTAPQDPVKEAQEIVNDRKVKVFWHKACINEKESTLTTLKKEELLKKTDGKVSVPSAENPEELIIKDVYSLKRGKRIYYLHDVTPQDIVRAEAEAVKKAQEAAAEKAAKEKLESAK